MRKVDEGGNPRRNLGILLLLLLMTISFIISFIYFSQGDERWFSRMALAAVLLGLYLNADRD